MCANFEKPLAVNQNNLVLGTFLSERGMPTQTRWNNVCITFLGMRFESLFETRMFSETDLLVMIRSSRGTLAKQLIYSFMLRKKKKKSLALKLWAVCHMNAEMRVWLNRYFAEQRSVHRDPHLPLQMNMSIHRKLKMTNFNAFEQPPKLFMSWVRGMKHCLASKGLWLQMRKALQSSW